MRVILKTEDNRELHFDAPDEKLLGAWLKAWFDSFTVNASYSPVRFVIEVRP
jgi:hypothetical protein